MINKFSNKLKLYSKVPPQIDSGRTLVPLRVIFEKIGAKVDYDQKTKVISISKENTNLQLTVGKSKAIENGEEVLLDMGKFLSWALRIT